MAQSGVGGVDEHLVGIGLVDGQVLDHQVARAGMQYGAAHGVLLGFGSGEE